MMTQEQRKAAEATMKLWHKIPPDDPDFPRWPEDRLDFNQAVWSMGPAMDDPDVAELVDHWREIVLLSKEENES